VTVADDQVLTRLGLANPVASPVTPAAGGRVEALLEAILADPDGAARPIAEPRPVRRPRQARRLLAIGLVGATVIAGVAYGAVRWTEDDLPAAGRGPSAFVLPGTDILPGGAESRRPPLFAELPVRPAIAFPVGVSYRDAVVAYYEARQAGEVLPDGATLVDPLPAGKVVRVAGGQVALDPAAPVGYDLGTGLVRRFPDASPSSIPAPVLPRCQVLLGMSDAAGADCPGAPARVAQVQEKEGAWRSAGTIAVTAAPALLPTTVSLLSRPITPADAVPEIWRDPVAFPQFAQFGADLDGARLALERAGARFFVIPASDESVCIVSEGRIGSSTTCASLSNLAVDGAILITAANPDGTTTHSALVADGWVSAETSDGRKIAVAGNFLSVTGPDGGLRITLVGAGRRRVITRG